MSIRVIGLTGGIACGKTLVSSFLSQAGASVIDADLLARQVVEPGMDGLKKVVARFGAQVMDAQGELDRAALGHIVFGSEEARKDLEAMLHPLIAAAFEGARDRLEQLGKGEVIYDAALLVESGYHEKVDGLIAVICEEEKRIDRLIARDGISRETALKRIAVQMPVGEKADLADWVIDNSGDPGETERQTLAVWKSINEWGSRSR